MIYLAKKWCVTIIISAVTIHRGWLLYICTHNYVYWLHGGPSVSVWLDTSMTLVVEYKYWVDKIQMVVPKSDHWPGLKEIFDFLKWWKRWKTWLNLKKKEKLALKFVHFKKPLTWSSFLWKSVVIFAEIKTKSVKMTTLLNEMRIVHLSSWNERTLAND